MEEKTGQKWLWRIVDFVNPLRDPSLTVAAVLTFIEEAGQHDPWYWYIIIALINWLAVRGVVWLVVNFTFASTFVSRRLWWTVQHPRLAWRKGCARRPGRECWARASPRCPGQSQADTASSASRQAERMS